jgi:hypothetical protein
VPEHLSKTTLGTTIKTRHITIKSITTLSIVYDNDYTSIINIYFYESFSTPNSI